MGLLMMVFTPTHSNYLLNTIYLNAFFAYGFLGRAGRATEDGPAAVVA